MKKVSFFILGFMCVCALAQAQTQKIVSLTTYYGYDTNNNVTKNPMGEQIRTKTGYAPLIYELSYTTTNMGDKHEDGTDVTMNYSVYYGTGEPFDVGYGCFTTSSSIYYGVKLGGSMYKPLTRNRRICLNWDMFGIGIDWQKGYVNVLGETDNLSGFCFFTRPGIDLYITRRIALAIQGSVEGIVKAGKYVEPAERVIDYTGGVRLSAGAGIRVML